MSSFDETVRGYLKPVLQFLDDPAITEVMINGPVEVWVEKGGRLFLTPAAFTEEGLSAAAKNIAQFVGRVLSNERPRLDARLPDGSRIHVILPPVSRKGTCIAIRKFFPRNLTMDDLIGFGTLDAGMAEFLERAVRGKITCIVAGGTSSGKTTLLNILARAIPDHERIVTIEDAAELRIDKPHVVPLETRPPDAHGKGGINIRDLLHSSLRLRPDRIIIGEVRGPEAFDLVQALNTGHGGSMCTTHANAPVSALRRIESLCLMSEVDLPLTAVRAQVASAIDVVICCARLPDGTRKLTHVAEVLPLDEKGEYRTRDLFRFEVEGRTPEGAIGGRFVMAGGEPVFAARIKAAYLTDVEEHEIEEVEPVGDGAEEPVDLGPEEISVVEPIERVERTAVTRKTRPPHRQ
ncbi:MAG: CpaF family protein [Deltaproteobacteria bacterium]|nr:CpaF family protein [Deltaproteobacteria bacterium]